MFEVRVEAEFAAAHFLKNYHGKCEQLHGHNYRVLAHVRGEQLDEGGMLCDFGVLKNALRKVCARLDHLNLNDLKNDGGQFVFDQNPSAERIAEYIFVQLRQELGSVSAGRGCAPLLYAVDVYETPTSRARYMP
ncbi:MAG: 6-carboxytetrahydropterin synthase QueD [Bacteroides sp.]|nr:6-carboxytetrahydropterin synthase QueD [Prevotella sp.]MCM1408756.1 6-carboxytetrahydropterin synthase QueD [Treponema brennaborense]MCM1470671.1 6-carboxytetrahydropterin synthase QueD [Bacteroides sp.]